MPGTPRRRDGRATVGRRTAGQEGRRARLRRWLQPGMGLKRWLLVVFLGELGLAFAGGLLIRQLYRELGDGPGESVLDLLTLQFLPLGARIGVLLAVGVSLFLVGFWRLVNALLAPFDSRREPLVELIYQKRSLARGPRIVAIGGGTGLSTLLRGLKQFSSNITAVVTVADDGGSSGKLRAELGVPPVGDIRNCIAALADEEAVMTRLLQYRFPAEYGTRGADSGAAGIRGHAFGNLLIAALTAIEGDFEEGVRQSNRVLAVRGQVVPAAPVPLTLHAELDDGAVLEGQSVIAGSSRIRRVWLTPPDVRASRRALDAVATAELLVLGPGSLYTSLLPSLLVPELRAALQKTSALRVYVCNVATQVGETDGYSLSDHVAALESHGAAELLDVVLVNDNFTARVPENYPAAPVRIDLPLPTGSQPTVVLRDVVDDDDAHHHDPVKLASALAALLEERSASGPTPIARSA